MGRPGAAEGDGVAGYFARTPAPARKLLREMRDTIRSVVPREAVEVISYRIPAFKHGHVLVWYAAFTHHCSLYPITAAIRRAFSTALEGYETSKGTVRFPLTKPPPVGLVKRLVKARIAEVRKQGGT